MRYEPENKLGIRASDTLTRAMAISSGGVDRSDSSAIRPSVIAPSNHRELFERSLLSGLHGAPAHSRRAYFFNKPVVYCFLQLQLCIVRDLNISIGSRV